MYPKDQRGLVLSGVALLLILPAILLSASYLSIVHIGSETTALKSTSNKVYSTGLNVEDTLKWMWAEEGVPVNQSTLQRLETEYERTTGLAVSLSHPDDNLAKIQVIVLDVLGKARFEDNLKLMGVA